MAVEPVSDERRTDRGYTDANGKARFTDGQRLWLLERDLDGVDDRFDEIRVELQRHRKEMKEEVSGLHALVANRLNWIVGIGFSLLIAVIASLVVVVANH